jgi:glycerol uptake facilitator-like aquaporin
MCNAFIILCAQNVRLRKLAAGLSGAMAGAAVLYGFCYAFHLQTEDDSSCLVHLPSGDPLWPVLSGFVFSFHTPTVAAACFLLVTAVQQPKDATKLKTATAILVSQVSKNS